MISHGLMGIVLSNYWPVVTSAASPLSFQSKSRSVKIRKISDIIPSYPICFLQDTYDIAMPSFLAGGGDGYDFLKEEIVKHTDAGKY